MSVELLAALEAHDRAIRSGRPRDFTFRHQLRHDFESLIWVIVYAMMVRRKTILEATDPKVCAEYKDELNRLWGVHSHTNLGNCHGVMIFIGTNRFRTIVEDLLFPDPLEAEFFRAAMVLVRSQCDGEQITYEKLRDLFHAHVQKAEQANLPTLASA